MLGEIDGGSCIEFTQQHGNLCQDIPRADSNSSNITTHTQVSVVNNRNEFISSAPTSEQESRTSIKRKTGEEQKCVKYYK